MLITDYKLINNYIEEIWVYEDGDLKTRRKAYRINERTKIIKFYPNEDDFFKEIVIEGFKSLPDDFSEYGYIKHGIQYYLKRKLANKRIKKIIISKERYNSLKTINDLGESEMILNYGSFKTLRDNFITINGQSTRDKNKVIDSFFYTLFPEKFEGKETSYLYQYRNVINNLNPSIIEYFTPNDLELFESFIGQLLNKRYDSSNYRFLQLTRTKIQVDSIAIDRILCEFQNNLDIDISESQWGKYLMKNLFLLDSKYVKIIPQLNVILSGSRNADFGMIDSKGYLDIFEIKKPSTPLLSNETDRGNYYWNSATVKAIVQAEKYLYNAERKASSLAEDIRRENKVTVKVVRPRAVLIIGHSNQLDNDEKKDDFKVLRQSLKNVEIILYDELLEGLENQKNKYFDQITNLEKNDD